MVQLASKGMKEGKACSQGMYLCLLYTNTFEMLVSNIYFFIT